MFRFKPSIGEKITVQLAETLTIQLMSSSQIFAEPMLDTGDYIQRYKEQLIKLDNKGLLPRLNLKMRYKVYSIRGSEFGAHKSIVLTTNNKHFVTVELGFIKVNGTRHIYPVTRSIDKSEKAKMEYLGKIETTGEELIESAIAVMKKFGSYFKLSNNCQNFCNMYVEAIGLKRAQKLTDGAKLALAVLLAAIVAYVIIQHWNIVLDYIHTYLIYLIKQVKACSKRRATAVPNSNEIVISI